MFRRRRRRRIMHKRVGWDFGMSERASMLVVTSAPWAFTGLLFVPFCFLFLFLSTCIRRRFKTPGLDMEKA